MTKKKYKTLLFDLDGTLWDFRKNSKEALLEIYADYNLKEYSLDFEQFISTYHHHNDLLWKEYRQGKVAKDVLRWKRFDLTLQDLGIKSEELAHTLDREYLNRSKIKTNLIPGAMNILEYLSQRYPLYLVTNGFNEVQFSKIHNSKLERFFHKVITSEMAGVLKPDPDFFRYALQICHSKNTECLLIGDDPEADIAGARKAGIDQVYFNPGLHPEQINSTWEIERLEELKKIL